MLVAASVLTVEKSNKRRSAAWCMLATGMRRTVLEFAPALTRIFPEFKNLFEAPLQRIKRIRFQKLDGARAFEMMPDGTWLLDPVPLEEMTGIVIKEQQKLLTALQKDDQFFQATTLAHLIRDSAGLYLLHEIQHPSQGLHGFSKVAELRASAGRSAIAELDGVADFNAARCSAAFRLLEQGCSSWDRYYAYLADALFLQGLVWSKVFPVDLDRIDKFERILGLMIALARMSVAAKRGIRLQTLPFVDRPWTAAVGGEGYLSLSLKVYNPDPVYPYISGDIHSLDLQEMHLYLSKGQFIEALDFAEMIVDRAGLV